MALSVGSGPLSPDRGDLNFSLDHAPKNQIVFDDYPRRMRAFVGEHEVLDTTKGKLLFESDHHAVFYFPLTDLDEDVLVESDTSTHCPYKGDASYYSLKVGDRVVEDAVWFYPAPVDAAPWLKGYAALYWDKIDLWLQEDEPVKALKDPYHRVDVMESSTKVKVRANGVLIAESDRPKLVFETSIPPRIYLLRSDVLPGVLTQTATAPHCPYKGDATYWSITTPDGVIEDGAWSYENPLPEMSKAPSHLSFAGEGIEISVD